MEEDKHSRKLTDLIEDAADDLPGAVEAFFAALLEADVFVATVAGVPEPGSPAVVGESSAADHNFVTVVHEGEECVPIFSEEEFVEKWAGRPLPLTKKRFQSLLWMVGEDTWLYLNPGQEVGKEITPWEVELLKKGREAIAELADAQQEHHPEEIEVRSDPDLYPELKRHLLPVLELAEELEEAFLVAVKEVGFTEEKPVLGLKYRKPPAGKKEYIRSEIEAACKDHERVEFSTIVILDDLEKRTSPNHALFEDAKPFYFARKPEGKSGEKDRGTKALGRVCSIFTGRGESKD